MIVGEDYVAAPLEVGAAHAAIDGVIVVEPGGELGERPQFTRPGAMNTHTRVPRDVLHYDAGRIETLERAGVSGPAAGKAAPSGQ